MCSAKTAQLASPQLGQLPCRVACHCLVGVAMHYEFKDTYIVNKCTSLYYDMALWDHDFQLQDRSKDRSSYKAFVSSSMPSVSQPCACVPKSRHLLSAPSSQKLLSVDLVPSQNGCALRCSQAHRMTASNRVA
jgi:hypothetical protein